MRNPTQNGVTFKRSLLAMSIMAIGLPTLVLPAVALAQDEPAGDGVEEVLVLGVRGAQKSAIDVKRNAATIVDGISAEDIGKLPDSTITDSLQRITGVQVQRNGGEGGALSIRGMSQVALLLNGEQYLAAGNITSAQPDLTDVPAQLLHASQVYKSLDVRNAQSGITGTINIQTYRPLDFKEGFSAAGGFEESRGELTKQTDPTFNALINWRNDDTGILFSAVTGKKNLAKNFTGSAVVSDDGGLGIAPAIVTDEEGNTRLAEGHGFEAFSQGVERNRDGFNAAFQHDFGNGFNVVAEGFYTKAKSYDRRVGINFSNRWSQDDNSENETPTHIRTNFTGKDGSHWIVPDQYDIRALWVKSYSVDNVDTQDSKNFNLELNYDNGGPFTGSLRAVHGSANALKYEANAEGDLSNFQGDNYVQQNTFYPIDVAKNFTADTRHTEIGSAGGYYVNANPQGYAEDQHLTLARNNFHMTWGGFNTPISGGLGDGKTLADYLGNKNSQTLAGYSMDSNSDLQSDLNAVSAKGKYTFEESFFKDVEIGLRHSKREVGVEAFAMFSSLYKGSKNKNGEVNTNGCLVQWKSIDVQLNGGDDGTQCSAGEFDVNDPSVFLPYTANKPQKLDANGAQVTFVTNLGSHVAGIPGFWAVDPHSFDDPVAFQTKAFGNLERVIKPSNSYDIDLEETSAYISSNFEAGIYSGNVGARIIQSTLGTNVYTTDGQTRAYGDTLIPTGRERTEKKTTEVLPSLNLSVAVQDDLKLRFAIAKTKQELDLDKYGSSLAIDTIIDVNNPTVRVPLSWSSDGNPNLKPWLATNIDFSAEYYVGQASMFSVGAYYIKIDSFVDQKTYNKDIEANGNTYNLPGHGPVEGSDGKVQGIELAAKFAFSDFTSGFLSNFGLDTNYTYSPSERKSATNFDVDGKYYPFADNSKNTYNLALWYEHDKLQARVALNHRDERYVQDSGEYGYSLYELGGSYVDANISYDFTSDITVFVEGSNITSTDSRFVYRLTKSVQQDAFYYDNEARYTLGVRAKF